MSIKILNDIFSPFAWCFAELFSPPYDLLDILMIGFLLLCVVLLCAVTYSDIRFRIACRNVNRFFKEHEVSSGMVVEYRAEKTTGHTLPMPVMAGTSFIVVPHTVSGSAYFTVTLDCHTAGEHFYAKYGIPEEDFREHRKGDHISIGDNWEPLGYEII